MRWTVAVLLVFAVLATIDGYGLKKVKEKAPFKQNDEAPMKQKDEDSFDVKKAVKRLADTERCPGNRSCHPQMKIFSGNTKTYVLVKNKRPFEEARRRCRWVGGDLATLPSFSEVDHVAAEMSSADKECVWLGAQCVSGGGGNVTTTRRPNVTTTRWWNATNLKMSRVKRAGNEGHGWYWFTGEALSLTSAKWGALDGVQQPEGKGKCLAISKEISYFLNDECDTPHYYMCQFM